jgi:hypothetical protein
MHAALLIDRREALNSEPAATDSARDSSDAADIPAKISDAPLLHSPSPPPAPASDTVDEQGPAPALAREQQILEQPTAEAPTTTAPPLGGKPPGDEHERPDAIDRDEGGHKDAATVEAGGDAGSSQEPGQVDLNHEDHLWSELINSPAFSEWNQKQEELAQRAITKVSDDGRRPSMLLEDDSESKAMEDETTEAGAWAKNEKEDEEAEEVVSSVRERKKKRKRKSEKSEKEKKKKKGRKTSSHRAKKAKQVNDSDENAEKEEEEGEKQQRAAPLDDDDNDPLSLPLRAGWTREVLTSIIAHHQHTTHTRRTHI